MQPRRHPDRHPLRPRRHGFDFATKAFGIPSDPALGTRRARAAALLTLALPGSAYLYQGEELGLPEADVPLDRIQDPMHFRSGGTDPDPGRDGCRVPLPWSAEPWLPQPAHWATYAADRQDGDPHSMLTLYRTAPPCGCAGTRPGSVVAACAGCPPRPGCWPSPAPTACSAWSTSPATRCPSRPVRASC